MTKNVECPGCGSQLPLPDGPPGRRVRCPDCFQVFFDDDKAAPAAPPREAVAPVKRPSKVEAVRRPKEEVLDEVIALPDEPRPRRRPRDEEDDRDERPRKKGGGGMALLLVLGGLAGLLLVVVAGGGLAAYLYFGRAQQVVLAPKPQDLDKPPPRAIDKEELPPKVKDAAKLPGKDRPQPKDDTRPKDADKPPPKDKQPDKDKLPPKDKQPDKDKTKPKEAVPARAHAVKNLPSPAAGLAVAGGGRFLLLHLPKDNKIVTYDVTTGDFGSEIALTSDRTLFAGGRDKVVVFDAAAGVLQRFDLASGKRETAAAVDAGSTLAMGHASAGPILLGGKFYDLATLRPTAAQMTALGQRDFAAATQARASADGTTFAAWKADGTPQRWFVAVYDRATVRYEVARGHALDGYAAPAEDGHAVFTEVASYDRTGRRESSGQVTAAVPALRGSIIFALRPKEGSADFIAGEQPRVSVSCSGINHPIVQPKGVVWPEPHAARGSKITLDQRILYLPSAKKLVVLPQTDDKLVSYPFDPEDDLKAAGADYLFVASRWPRQAEPGKRFTYRPDVRSSKGGVKLSLGNFCPEGMKVEGDAIVWDCPSNLVQAGVHVRFVLTDSGGKELRCDMNPLRVDQDDKLVKVPNPKDKFPKKDKDKGKGDPDLTKKGGDLGSFAWDAPAPKLDLRVPNMANPKILVPLKGGAVTNVVVGGGGRYLAMVSPKDRRVHVFDANKLAVVKSLPIDDENVKIAASADRLVVAVPRTNTLQVYDLGTMELERSAPAPAKGQIQDVTMGHASAGPLLVWSSAGDFGRDASFSFLDPATLKGVGAGASDALAKSLGLSRVRSVAASGDGRSFLLRSTFALHVASRRGDRMALRNLNENANLEYAALNDDGTLIFTNSGVRDLTTEAGDSREVGSSTVPALQGPYYASGKSMYLPNQAKEVAALPARAPQELQGIDFRNPIPTNKRLFVMPASRLLVFLMGNNNILVVSRYDVYAAAEKANVPYLYVTSRPPEIVKAGGDVEYKVAFRSRRGGVKVQVVEGPKEMKVSEDGTVSWKVPAGEAGKDVGVKLSLTDAGNQEIHHAFTLYVRAEGRAMEKKE